MIGTLVFLFLAVVIPGLGFFQRERARAALLALDDDSRPGFYWQQALQLVALGTIACSPLMLGQADLAEYGLAPVAGEGAFWGAVAVAAILWLATRRCVVEVERRPGLRRWIEHKVPAQVQAMLPARPSDLRGWGVLSMAAGLGEELAYRAFMLWFLAPLIGLGPAVVLSAACFGASHFYEGSKAVLLITAAGLVFGGLYVWAGSLLPVIALHALYDWEMGRAFLALRMAEPGLGSESLPGAVESESGPGDR